MRKSLERSLIIHNQIMSSTVFANQLNQTTFMASQLQELANLTYIRERHRMHNTMQEIFKYQTILRNSFELAKNASSIGMIVGDFKFQHNRLFGPNVDTISKIIQNLSYPQINNFNLGFNNTNWQGLQDAINKIELCLPENIYISPHNNVISDGIESITFEDLQNAINESISSSGLLRLDKDSKESFISQLINEINNTLNIQDLNLLGILKSYFIIPFIWLLIGVYTTPFFGNSPTIFHDNIINSRNQIIKQIQRNMDSLQANKIIIKSAQALKIVSANELPIRSNRSTKSNKVGILYFGDAVIVVQKRRNWTLIKKPIDESGKYLRGWTFTRYLKDLFPRHKR